MFDLQARLERELGRPVQVVVLDLAPAELAAFARVDEIASDLRMQRFVEHTLQIAIQASLDARGPRVILGGRWVMARFSRRRFRAVA